MEKTILSQTIKSLMICVSAGAALAACGGGSSQSSSGSTQLLADGEACAAAWVSTTAYNGGTKVSRNGRNYTSAFWTQGNDPATSSGAAGSGQPWTTGYLCGSGTPTPTPTPAPTPTPTPAPTPASFTVGATYSLINPESGMALDVTGNGTADGTRVEIWDNLGNGAQQWRIENNGKGSYRFVNPQSNSLLSVAGSGTTNGTAVQIWHQDGTNGQDWNIQGNSDGTITLTKPDSNQALDVPGCSTTHGTMMATWANGVGTCNNSGGQKWKLVANNYVVPSAGFGSLVSQAQFDTMFPPSGRNSFYTYAGLVSAANSIAGFTTTGSTTVQKQEAAAFLANVAHETGRLLYVVEQNTANYGSYCDTSQSYGCPAGTAAYYGRGPLQLSWNFNYKAAGDYLGINLLANPNLVATDATVTWKSAIWYWMTQNGPNTMTAHNAMINSLGFGQTIKSINGALECNGNNVAQMNDRINFYNSFVGTLGVAAGSNLSC